VVPIHNPVRLEVFETHLLLKDPDLVYMDELVYSNGAVYRGQVKPIAGAPESDDLMGVRHGYGVQVWVDGAKYKGYWVENRAEGKGCFWHADGDTFEGDFVNDKSNGNGVYTCQDGTVYSGSWVDDV
jgi:hypothetical protein